MCGIFGIVGPKIDEAHLKKATNLLAPADQTIRAFSSMKAFAWAIAG